MDNETIIFECVYCGSENEIDIDDFDGEEYCTECGELNEVDIDEYDTEEYYEYDEEEEF